MRDRVRIAAVQMDPELMRNDENLDNIIDQARVASHNRADLVVFPECAVTGYVFASREEAVPFMETVPGPTTDRLTTICS